MVGRFLFFKGESMKRVLIGCFCVGCVLLVGCTAAENALVQTIVTQLLSYL